MRSSEYSIHVPRKCAALNFSQRGFCFLRLVDGMQNSGCLLAEPHHSAPLTPSNRFFYKLLRLNKAPPMRGGNNNNNIIVFCTSCTPPPARHPRERLLLLSVLKLEIFILTTSSLATLYVQQIVPGIVYLQCAEYSQGFACRSSIRRGSMSSLWRDYVSLLAFAALN